MKIDIDALSESELVDLNHRIVERLRFIGQMRAHRDMLEFGIGDRVWFEPDYRGRIEGMVTRYNKKTVSVITDDGRRWTVSPRLLQRVGSPNSARGAKAAKPQKPWKPHQPALPGDILDE